MKYHNIPTLFDNQASLINGKNIGTDSVRYIQDAGQKTAGNTYIDRNTNELYVCVTTTNSVNNDGNFSKFNLKEAFNKLDNFDKLDKLTVPTWYEYSSAVSQLTLEEFLNEKLQKNRKLQIEFQGYGPYEVDMTKVGLFLTSGDRQSKLAEITFIQYSSSTVIFNNILIDGNDMNESIYWAGGSGVFKEMTLRKTGLNRFSTKAEWVLISKSYT